MLVIITCLEDQWEIIFRSGDTFKVECEDLWDTWKIHVENSTRKHAKAWIPEVDNW